MLPEGEEGRAGQGREGKEGVRSTSMVRRERVTTRSDLVKTQGIGRNRNENERKNRIEMKVYGNWSWKNRTCGAKLILWR